MDAVVVACGGACGAVLRHGAHELGKRRGQGPASIIAVNVVGSFLFGIVAATSSAQAQLALGTGFCGALTTFSTYSMDTVRLVQAKQYGHAAGYVALSNALSIGAAGVGFSLGSIAKRRLGSALQLRSVKPPRRGHE